MICTVPLSTFKADVKRISEYGTVFVLFFKNVTTMVNTSVLAKFACRVFL